MRSQNIKTNSFSSSGRFTPSGKVGGASAIGLFLLAFLLINPIVSLPASALEGDDVEGNDGIETYATTASTVTISFLPTSASGSVTPVDTTSGDKAKVDVQAKVEVKNSGGYKVYVGSESSDLKNGNNTIPSVSATTTYAAMPLNSWGYSFRKANSATDKTVADSYDAMPATVRSSALDQNTSTKISSETRYYMLSFAARIGSDKPAGTYTNNVTMSVVSDPMDVAVSLADISNMQDMTPSHCAGTAPGTQKQLKDTRDGKYYWVGKLPDGNCWMTQNLDLDLSKDEILTSSDTDLQDPVLYYAPIYDTVSNLTLDTILTDSNGQRSWSLGDYKITNPNISSDCGTGKLNASECPGQFTAGYPTPTSAGGTKSNDYHYLLGNHYQWNAATAGTGYNLTSGQASSSICPKGWKLPTSGDGGDFAKLVTALGITNPVTDAITKAPFYGVRSGIALQDSNLWSYAGDTGYLWSSTPTSDSERAFILDFWSTSGLLSANSNFRERGFPIRCIAR